MSLSHLSRVEPLALLRHSRTNAAAWLALLRRKPRAGFHVVPWSGGVAIGALVTLLILMGAMELVDAWAVTHARTLPSWVHASFRFITEFGRSGWFLWPVGVALLALGLASPPLILRVAVLVTTAVAVRLTFLFAAVAIPGLFAALLKHMIGRGRPFVGGSADPYLFDPFVFQAAYASLPSGHATTAFAIAVATGALWPQLRPYVWVYAVLIGLSRVVGTVHHPSDVIAGAIVGIIGALMIRNWFAARRLAFAVTPGGRVYAKPGPSLQRVKRVAARLLQP